MQKRQSVLDTSFSLVKICSHRVDKNEQTTPRSTLRDKFVGSDFSRHYGDAVLRSASKVNKLNLKGTKCFGETKLDPERSYKKKLTFSV